MEITSAGGANTLFWEVYLDNMTAGYTLAGVETDVYSEPYDATAHRWCRIREDQGTVYWEASPDGVNWTFLGSTLSTFDTTNSTIKIGAGNDRGETIPPIVASNFQLGDVSGLFGQPGTVYIDGVPGRRVPSDGQYHHVVVVLASPGNVQFALGPVITIDHLALYPQTMSATQVADLFLHSNGGSRLISVVDSMPFSVTQGSPEVDVYAYSWSVVSGGTA
jgi:hypothetical protein